MSLLTMKVFEYLHCLLENNALYVIEDDRLVEWSAVQQFWFTAPALPLMFAALGDEIAHPFQI